MTVTINTQTKTLLIEGPIKFLELQEFVGEFNLRDYTLDIKNSLCTCKNNLSLNEIFKNINRPGEDKLIKPSYSPTCDYTYRPETMPKYYSPYDKEI